MIPNFIKNVKTKIILINSNNNTIQTAKSINNYYGTSSVNMKEGLVFLNKSPIEIYQEIDNTSPYNRYNVMSNYKDQKIKWVLDFYSLNKLEIPKNPYFGIFNFENSDVTVFFNIDINEYPIFKITNRGEKFSVIGEIKQIDDMGIELEVESIVKL